MSLNTMVALLAEQPESALLEMRDRNRADLARITVEGQFIDEALEEQARRKSRAGRTTVGKLTRDRVRDLVLEMGRPVTTREVQETLESQGVDVTTNAVRNHLGRLVEIDHVLLRLPDGRFSPPAPLPAFHLAPADDDIPF